MSAYKKITTQFRSGESLLRALADCGLDCERSADLRANTITLRTHWRRYDGQDQAVAVAVQREALRAKVRAMDGLGFAWNGEHYELVHDQSDGNILTGTLNEIRRRYAYHETMNAFHQRGWVVGDTTFEGNEINITFRQYGGMGGY